MLGSLISGGLGLIGGIMNSNNQMAQFWANRKFAGTQLKKQQYWNKRAWNFAQQQWKYAQNWQKRELTRNSLAYKMKKFKQAGIHPLYGLGMSGGGGGTPAAQVGSPSLSSGGISGPGYSGSDGLAQGLSAMGQGIGRAVDQFATQEDRNITRASAALQLENQGLQNELIRSQIRRIDAGTGPAMPSSKGAYLIDGQGNTVGKVDIDRNQFTQRLPEPKQNIDLGKTWQANPYVSNAEDIEARHGEFADMIWGPAVSIPADIYWNALRDKTGRKPWYHQLWDETFGTKPAY